MMVECVCNLFKDVIMRFFLIFSFCLFFVACNDSEHKQQDVHRQTLENQVNNANTTGDIADSKNISTSANDLHTKNKVKSDATMLYAKCAPCHGKDGKSVAPGSVGGILIATLNKAQVIESLRGYRSKTLSKGGNYAIMYMQTKNLSDEDIEALAVYIDSF